MSNRLLNVAAQEMVDIDEDVLTAFWNTFMGESSDISQTWSKRMFIDSFISQVRQGLPTGGLFMKTKAFRVNLSGNMAKSAAVTSFIATILWYFNCQDIPKTALMAVVATLFVIERIELKKSDEVVVASIPLRKKAGKFLSPEKWYKLLPTDIVEQVNYLGFCDLLERLELAGFAKDEDGKYLLFKKGENKLRIHFF